MKNIGNILLNILSLLVAVAGALMAMDATIQQIGLFSPQVAIWWPAVLASSTIIHRVAAILKDIWGDWVDDGVINNSFPKKLPLILLPFLFLSACASHPKSDSAYGVSFGVSYGDAATLMASRNNGRTNFGFGVDAKQVIKAIYMR